MEGKKYRFVEMDTYYEKLGVSQSKQHEIMGVDVITV